MREGKCCLVMHVRFAMYTLLSQLPILSYVSLSLLLSLLFPFKLTVTNFLGYWALFVLVIPLLMIVVFFPYSWGTVPFIPNINLRWFSFFSFAFHQPFLSTIGTQYVLAVYRWVSPTIFWPLVVGLVPLLA